MLQRNDGASTLHAPGCLYCGVSGLLQATAKFRLGEDALVNQSVRESRAELQKISLYFGTVMQSHIPLCITIENPPIVRRFLALSVRILPPPAFMVVNVYTLSELQRVRNKLYS